MANATLKELLRELESTRGLRGRLRLLARSFDLLRSLDRADRERVALRVGSDWAWSQIERAFMKDGRLSEGEEVIRQAFETIGSADPAELRVAARRLRARDTEGLERAAVQTLERILEEDELASDPEHPGELEPGADEPKSEADLDAVIQSVAVAADEARERHREREAAGNPVQPTDPGVPEASVRSASPRSKTPTPRLPNPGQPRLQPDVPEPADQPAPVASAANAPVAAPPANVPQPPDNTWVPAAPAWTSGELSSGAARLRALRALRTPGHARALGRSGRRRLVEQLGGGWAARRALSAMIESAELDDLDEALSLLDRLDRSSRRTWCLIDLVEYATLAPAEREQVLEAAPDPMARRRIERRLRSRREGGAASS